MWLFFKVISAIFSHITALNGYWIEWGFLLTNKCFFLNIFLFFQFFWVNSQISKYVTLSQVLMQIRSNIFIVYCSKLTLLQGFYCLEWCVLLTGGDDWLTHTIALLGQCVNELIHLLITQLLVLFFSIN